MTWIHDLLSLYLNMIEWLFVAQCSVANISCIFRTRTSTISINWKVMTGTTGATAFDCHIPICTLLLCLWLVETSGSYFQVLLFPPPIKLTEEIYNWYIVESDVENPKSSIRLNILSFLHWVLLNSILQWWVFFNFWIDEKQKPTKNSIGDTICEFSSKLFKLHFSDVSIQRNVIVCP